MLGCCTSARDALTGSDVDSASVMRVHSHFLGTGEWVYPSNPGWTHPIYWYRRVGGPIQSPPSVLSLTAPSSPKQLGMVFPELPVPGTPRPLVSRKHCWRDGLCHCDAPGGMGTGRLFRYTSDLASG